MLLRIAVLVALGAVPALGQGIVLELRPRVGDTLRMRLDQETEVVGTRSGGGALTVNTSVSLFSRAIVLGTDGPAAVILAVTDSVDVRSNDQHALALAQQARRSLEGRQVKLRLVPDGTIGPAEEERGVSRDVKNMMAIMPGSFPKTPIAVGDTWMREMPIPDSAQMNVPDGGSVKARFRLDSLGRGGELAYVSMRGTFQPADSAQRGDAAAGSVSGTLVVNRKRGWLSESRFVIQMRATLPALARARPNAMQFRTKITQYMRVLGERRP